MVVPRLQQQLAAAAAAAAVASSFLHICGVHRLQVLVRRVVLLLGLVGRRGGKRGGIGMSLHAAAVVAMSRLAGAVLLVVVAAAADGRVTLSHLGRAPGDVVWLMCSWHMQSLCQWHCYCTG
jgi:hypothetical protein